MWDPDINSPLSEYYDSWWLWHMLHYGLVKSMSLHASHKMILLLCINYMYTCSLGDKIDIIPHGQCVEAIVMWGLANENHCVWKFITQFSYLIILNLDSKKTTPLYEQLLYQTYFKKHKYICPFPHFSIVRFPGGWNPSFYSQHPG